jgi:hypothetical protein
MFKKAMMLAVAAAALVAFAIPATASARWQHHNTALQQNANTQLTGQFRFQGESIGAVECQTDTTATLIAGQTTASVTAFGVDLTEAGSTVTSKCFVNSTLEAFGCSDVAQMTAGGLPWTAHATNTQTITVTTGLVQTHVHGGIFCPKTVQLTPGTVNINTSTAGTWTTGQLSGQLLGHGSVQQNLAISGHVILAPSNTYGVA